jgi:hypothetical protein
VASPLLRQGDVVYSRERWVRLGPVERYDDTEPTTWAAVGTVLNPGPNDPRTAQVQGGVEHYWLREKRQPQEEP